MNNLNHQFLSIIYILIYELMKLISDIINYNRKFQQLKLFIADSISSINNHIKIILLILQQISTILKVDDINQLLNRIKDIIVVLVKDILFNLFNCKSVKLDLFNDIVDKLSSTISNDSNIDIVNSDLFVQKVDQIEFIVILIYVIKVGVIVLFGIIIIFVFKRNQRKNQLYKIISWVVIYNVQNKLNEIKEELIETIRENSVNEIITTKKEIEQWSKALADSEIIQTISI
ncbi:hypothetical protein K502DRAFT_346675 [Neoconidiobolus thromboides FSU 785]|nr:hypothetical protein K502DRAFT_346675 [Neoconidiobolus thromboides FSU 785]